MKKITNTVAPLIYGAVVFALVITGLLYVAPPQTQAAAPQVFTFGGSSIAANTTYGGLKWSEGNPPHLESDFFVEIDQGSSVNTMTLGLQVSPDNTNWYTHTATSEIISDNAADASTYITATIHGLYFRIQAYVVNTNTVTPTIRVVLR